MHVTKESEILRHLSPKEFLGVGMNQVAYIRPIPSGDDDAVFSIHAADGTQLSIVHSYKDALIEAKASYDLLPVTLQ